MLMSLQSGAFLWCEKPLLPNFKKCCHFYLFISFTFNFQRQNNTFQHLSLEITDNPAVCDSYRSIFLTTAYLFAGDNFVSEMCV